ncbi:hypothetical protein GobsT_16890 [Gemmata obscuriglobus]|uniref:Uncharacterized protein n=1 Tax=Gemmata obscuriglobus TaxID=114 RepID=A0A2Z3H6F1_9BACT|nr:hypothetical protein [Gemmata obscuriglobus]AWM39922.1 hypothetical protein C1280_24900 [Gemmata obscuriglobus]QEG26941.1 hypothetical protein GobsT_16890 [Gemmata obscuriglobus]VTS03113.1 unnamed protein product [Gemmata obscuriglobus UQM 2246]
MFRMICALSLVCFATTAGGADRREKAAQLHKEVADLRAQLAAKEAELKRLEDVTAVPFVFAEKMKVGTAGPLGYEKAKGEAPTPLREFGVVQILDAERALVHAPSHWVPVQGGGLVLCYGTFVLRHPTAGLKVGGGVTPDAPWLRVWDTVTIDKRTYPLVEPYTPPAK